ncbi:MAG: hypothetical protein M0P57_01200 [Syntrophales bacterium]|jgi:predicted Fe-Mo cluster-binding NifX family protein|nr:hypothetical protein [Syntrophales bacterium]MDY0043134.1 NifB/NifX family molybdenum-iron cluster-binding protein [Syntrophales bacterium]
MKIAISADGSTMDAKVALRLSVAKYFLIVDVDSGAFEAVPSSINRHTRGAGVQTVMTAVNRGANVIITGYCSPGIIDQLKENGIEVLTEIKGTVKDALEHYRAASADENRTMPGGSSRSAILRAVKNSARQFAALLPVVIGVALLIGLFDAFVSKELLVSVFSGNIIFDSFRGACFGSIFAGNPINSYIIGGELLKNGISLFAVTAFIVSWVTVGVIQMPAEAAALGRKFAILRNGICFIAAIPVAILTVLIVNILERWLS